MNVAFDDWIPVVTTTGGRRLASVRQALTAGEQITDLAVRPHERVALMRLLLCVAHAALNGPKNYDDWCAAPAQLSSAVQQYLEKWKDSFELFHPERPWLQVADLKTGATRTPVTSTSKLIFSCATGNNTTLFDHGGMKEARRMEIGELALGVLTYQCFSPGGLISQVYWDGKQTSRSSKDAPCAPSSMIHALLRGGNLAESVHLNLPTYDEIRPSSGGTEIGKPVWECPPEGPRDEANIGNATTTYLGRLTPLSRFIRLDRSGETMLLGAGLAYPTFADGFPQEPTATVVVRTANRMEERTILAYRPSRALWRELSAIMVKRTADGVGGPLSLRAAQDERMCDVIVGALARDQAIIVDTAESVFKVPAKLVTPEGVSAYEAEVKVAEEIATRLAWAVEKYRATEDGGWEGRLKSAGPKKAGLRAKLRGIASTHYWTAVEKKLPLLMAHVESLGSDASLTTRGAWRTMLFACACDAYRRACGQETPRQIRAFAEGWRHLVKLKYETASKKGEDVP